MRRRGARSSAVAAAWMALASPQVASAWTCGVEPPGLVLPPPQVVAPRNTRPVVRLLIGGGGQPCAAQPCAVDVAALELRTAPGPGRAPRAVAVETVEGRAGDVATFTLTPLGVLEANRRYEVLAVLAGPDGTPGARRLLGTFRTGTAFDRTYPTWTGMRSLELIPWKPAATVAKRGKVITLSFGPQPQRTYAEVWGRPALDPETPPDLVTYAVRIGDATGHVDRAAVPRGYFRGEIDVDAEERNPHRLFWLGQVDECFAHTFDFPEHGTLTIGVTAVDLAGNESPMFVHRFDLDGP